MSTAIVFGLVGLLAAYVHFSVVSALVPYGALPLVANIGAFLCAFCVSFIGHNTWTFPGRRATGPALRRFFAVACGSFAVNELLYWVLLRFTEMSYQLALVVVLVLVATLTFAFSKRWAFA